MALLIVLIATLYTKGDAKHDLYVDTDSFSQSLTKLWQECDEHEAVVEVSISSKTDILSSTKEDVSISYNVEKGTNSETNWILYSINIVSTCKRIAIVLIQKLIGLFMSLRAILDSFVLSYGKYIVDQNADNIENMISYKKHYKQIMHNAYHHYCDMQCDNLPSKLWYTSRVYCGLMTWLNNCFSDDISDYMCHDCNQHSQYESSHHNLNRYENIYDRLVSKTGVTIIDRNLFIFIALHTHMTISFVGFIVSLCAIGSFWLTPIVSLISALVLKKYGFFKASTITTTFFIAINHVRFVRLEIACYSNIDMVCMILQSSLHISYTITFYLLIRMFYIIKSHILNRRSNNSYDKESKSIFTDEMHSGAPFSDGIRQTSPSDTASECSKFAFLKLRQLCVQNKTNENHNAHHHDVPRGLICGFVIDAPEGAPKYSYKFVKVIFRQESLGRIVNILQNKTLGRNDQNDPIAVACLVYSRYVDTYDINVYQQIPISVTNNRDNYGNRILKWWIMNNMDVNALKFYRIYSHLLDFTNYEHHNDGSLFPELMLNDPQDMKLYKSRYYTPVLDIYGKLHRSLGSYLCEQYHIEYAISESSTKLSSPQDLTNMTVDTLNPDTYDGERNGVVQKGTRAIICNSDQQCRLQSQPNMLMDKHPDIREQVQSNTNYFKNSIVGGVAYCTSSSSIPSEPFENNTKTIGVVSVPDMIGDGNSTAEINDILSQLTPESSGTFRVAKYLLKTMTALKPYIPRFSRQQSALEGVLNLNQFTSNTDIQFGAPFTYGEFLKNAKAGDMIAVHGFAALSNVICTIQSKLRGGSKFLSHVGILVDTTIIRSPGMIDGEMYLLESSAGGGVIGDLHDCVPNIFGLAKSGVQIRSMKLLLTQAIRQRCIYIHCPLKSEYRNILNQNTGTDRLNNNQHCIFSNAIPRYINRPYTLTAANFLLGVESACADFYNSSGSGLTSNVPICRLNATKNVSKLKGFLSAYGKTQSTPFGSEFFCSELVASVYVELGILHIRGNCNIVDIWGLDMDHELVDTLKRHNDADQDESSDVIRQRIISPRHIYPIDFFSKSSRIYMPYLFDKLHVIHPIE